MPIRGNGHDRPVVAMDIDGTLAEYHQWFLMFATMYFGRDFPHPSEVNPGQPLHSFMGISKARYRECKLAYRQGGMKRSMPALPGADRLCAAIRRRAELWICTTRPYLRLDNIDPDTREWLRRNSIRYDALLFDPVGGDGKYRELMRQAAGRVACALEDLPEQFERAAKAGVPYTFLRDQPYNRHFRPDPNQGARWHNWQEASWMVDCAITTWYREKAEHGK